MRTRTLLCATVTYLLSLYAVGYAQARPPQRSIEIELSTKMLRTILIARMAERGFDLRDESEHLLKFTANNANVTLTTIDLGQSTRILFSPNAPETVVAILGKIKADVRAVNAAQARADQARIHAEECEARREESVANVAKMGGQLLTEGCVEGAPRVGSESCKTYWRRYREDTAKEKQKLKALGCNAALPTMTEPFQPGIIRQQSK